MERLVHMRAPHDGSADGVALCGKTEEVVKRNRRTDGAVEYTAPLEYAIAPAAPYAAVTCAQCRELAVQRDRLLGALRFVIPSSPWNDTAAERAVDALIAILRVPR